MSKVELQHGYVLHARPYRDTSSLLEIFSRDYGRQSLVARG
ncbi:MAG: recombination protein O N-terminal domain-containing protein, partial [Thioalkalispiraceae bacterium]